MLDFWNGDGTEIMSPGTYGTQGAYDCELDRIVHNSPLRGSFYLINQEIMTHLYF